MSEVGDTFNRVVALRAVRAGDTLTMRWVITSPEPRPTLAGDIAGPTGTIVNQDGITVPTSKAKLLVHAVI